MTSMNISLPESMKEFVDERLEHGEYSSVSEYVRQLIRDDQKRMSHEKLEAMLIEGLESGEPVPVTEEFWTSLRERVAKRVKKSATKS